MILLDPIENKRMAFQVSPNVLVREKDLTNVIPTVATSIGAIEIQFHSRSS